MRQGGSRAMDQLLAEVAISSFADPEHLGSAARGMLAWGQPKPRRQVSASSERTSVANRREQRGRIDDTNTRNAREAPRLLVIAGDRGELFIVSSNPAVQHRAFFKKFFQELAGADAHFQV